MNFVFVLKSDIQVPDDEGCFIIQQKVYWRTLRIESVKVRSIGMFEISEAKFYEEISNALQLPQSAIHHQVKILTLDQGRIVMVHNQANKLMVINLFYNA